MFLENVMRGDRKAKERGKAAINCQRNNRGTPHTYKIRAEEERIPCTFFFFMKLLTRVVIFPPPFPTRIFPILISSVLSPYRECGAKHAAKTVYPKKSDFEYIIL